MTNEVKLNLTGDRLLVEERTGKLPDLPRNPEPANYEFSGVLGAVYEFLYFRLQSGLVCKELAVVTVDRENLQIKVQTNPNSSLNDVVTGAIEVNKDLKAFKINQVGNQFSRETLIGFLRTNRQYFPDKEAHGQLMSAVRNLQVKANIQVGKQEDNRGNRGSHFEKSVQADEVPLSTMIEIPVFVGERPVRLNLDICFDTSEQNVYFWFESQELNEVIYDMSYSRINDEVDKIKHLGFLVLES